jgi:uroporphyrinogen III methyltransferase/synthase
VVVTRAREQASGLRSRLESLGAEVLELPSIALEPVDFALPRLGDYAWLVFTSANGVTAFFDRGLRPAGLDTRALGGLRVAAIGPGTAHALAGRGVRADVVPERFVAESLLDAFPRASQGERLLLARAEQARDVLPEGLAERGYAVDVLAVYRTVPAAADPQHLARVRDGRIDAITFTSSSTVTNFCDLVGNLSHRPPLVVSIGPITSETARARGLRVDAEADPHTIDGLVTALLDVVAQRGARTPAQGPRGPVT